MHFVLVKFWFAVIMSANNQAMVFGSCSEPNMPYHAENTEHEPEPYDDLDDDDYLEIDDGSISNLDINEKEEEPLFVEDKTHNFKMQHPIQYEVIKFNLL